MNHLTKAINMILRGDNDKFFNILYEALKERAGVLLEDEYYKISSNLSENNKITESAPDIISVPITEEIQIKSVYTTKMGDVVRLTEEQVDSISKLYKKLNTSNKERMLKLLSESEHSINRIINLAKIEGTKNVK